MQYTLVGNEDGSSNITVYVAGQAPLAAHSSHPNFETILAGVLADNESVYDLFDIATSAGTKFQRLTERVAAANGRLYLDGEVVHDALSAQVVAFLKEGVEDWKPLVAFFENVQANPNEHSRTQLYGWLQAQKISLTPDGLLIGYKGVTKDAEGNLVSCTSGTAIADGEVVTGQIPNKVGTYVEMPRTEVMHNPRADCDAGLHVGSYEYAKGYGPVLIEVHVNPRDVVSVPDAGWKLRTCRYKVIGVIKDEYTTALVTPEKSQVKPSGLVKRAKRALTKKEVRPVKVGDVYEDTDKRRAGRTFKVFKVETLAGHQEVATGKSLPQNVTRTIKVSRLQSRKYKLVKKGRS